MRRFHSLVLRLKQWEVFLAMICIIAVVGYPLFVLGQLAFSWHMPFIDSPTLGLAMYIGLGIWLDAVLANGKRPWARMLSPLLLAILIVASHWLKYSPYGMLLFVPALALIAFVFVPAAKVIHGIEGRRSTSLNIILDTILIGCLFPFGVWLLQPRLNKATAIAG